MVLFNAKGLAQSRSLSLFGVVASSATAALCIASSIAVHVGVSVVTQSMTQSGTTELRDVFDTTRAYLPLKIANLDLSRDTNFQNQIQQPELKTLRITTRSMKVSHSKRHIHVKVAAAVSGVKKTEVLSQSDVDLELDQLGDWAPAGIHADRDAYLKSMSGEYSVPLEDLDAYDNWGLLGVLGLDTQTLIAERTLSPISHKPSSSGTPKKRTIAQTTKAKGVHTSVDTQPQTVGLNIALKHSALLALADINIDNYRSEAPAKVNAIKQITDADTVLSASLKYDYSTLLGMLNTQPSSAQITNNDLRGTNEESNSIDATTIVPNNSAEPEQKTVTQELPQVTPEYAPLTTQVSSATKSSSELVTTQSSLVAIQKEPSVSASTTPVGPTGPSEPKKAVKIEETKSTQSQNTIVDEQHYTGVVTEAFSSGNRAVPNALVQIIGTPWQVYTDDSGSFSFENISVDGILPVLVTKQGYMPRRIELAQSVQLPIELINENTAALSAKAANVELKYGAGFVFGQLTNPSEATDVQAMRVEISGPQQAEILYLDEKGLPNRALSMTSSRGQFMILNMVAGTYLVTVVDAFGNERSPHIMYVGEGEGIVRRMSIGEARWISGKVHNGVGGQEVDAAQVQLLGSSKTTITDKNGSFVLGPIYIDCSTLNYVQVEKSGFYRNRIDYKCVDQGGSDLYVFPKSHIDGLALESGTTLNSNNGLVIGHVSFTKSVKMQLWGPEEINSSATSTNSRGKDFYIGKDGSLNAARNRTSQNGTFLILDAPEGFSYIQAFSKDNRTLSSWPILTSPSTVNVYIQ